MLLKQKEKYSIWICYSIPGLEEEAKAVEPGMTISLTANLITYLGRALESRSILLEG